MEKGCKHSGLIYHVFVEDVPVTRGWSISLGEGGRKEVARFDIRISICSLCNAIVDTFSYTRDKKVSNGEDISLPAI